MYETPKLWGPGKCWQCAAPIDRVLTALDALSLEEIEDAGLPQVPPHGGIWEAMFCERHWRMRRRFSWS